MIKECKLLNSSPEKGGLVTRGGVCVGMGVGPGSSEPW